MLVYSIHFIGNADKIGKNGSSKMTSVRMIMPIRAEEIKVIYNKVSKDYTKGITIYIKTR